MNKTLIIIFVGAVFTLVFLSIFQEKILKESDHKSSQAEKGFEGWSVDYQESLKNAKKNQKNLLVVFTGSDWCPPCKMLHKNVFNAEIFKNYAKENLELLVLDFPQGKVLPEVQVAQNAKLASQFEVSTFPTILILSPEGSEITRMNYHGELANGFIERYQEKTRKK